MAWMLRQLSNSVGLVAGRNIIGRDSPAEPPASSETRLQLGITAVSVSRRHAVLTQSAAGALKLETISASVGP